LRSRKLWHEQCQDDLKLWQGQNLDIPAHSARTCATTSNRSGPTVRIFLTSKKTMLTKLIA
jgi:hypothetical protein